MMKTQLGQHRVGAAVLAATTLMTSHAFGQATCPIESETIEGAKANKLYAYFPTIADNGWPQTNVTPPLPAFDISSLTSYTGTVEQLRDAVRDVLIDDYCKYNA